MGIFSFDEYDNDFERHKECRQLKLCTTCKYAYSYGGYHCYGCGYGIYSPAPLEKIIQALNTEGSIRSGRKEIIAALSDRYGYDYGFDYIGHSIDLSDEICELKLQLELEKMSPEERALYERWISLSGFEKALKENYLPAWREIPSSSYKPAAPKILSSEEQITAMEELEKEKKKLIDELSNEKKD